jgi:alcohol dehydrogenase (cytochrome c)
MELSGERGRRKASSAGWGLIKRRNDRRRATALAVSAAALAIGVVAVVVVLGRPAGQPRADWPLFGNTSDNTRFTPADQMDASSVEDLRVAWERGQAPGASTWETYPVVVGGRMYVTTNTNEVLALDAVTGRVIWKYVPKVDFLSRLPRAGTSFPANRGVAVADGTVYELTFDCHLVALDATTGKLLWRTKVADTEQGYYESTAPTVWSGLVVAGSSGGDNGARGFVAAYDGQAGTQVWRRYTVPKRGQGWLPRGGHHGGGAVWMPPTIDASTGILYFGTGNPSPDFYGAVRPGANPYTSGVMAVRARTGEVVWFHQEVPHDVWDHDAASPVVIFDTKVDGRGVRAVAQAGKSGRFFVLSARTGRPLFRPTPFVDINDPPPNQDRTLRCPGRLGGSSYAPVAYSPRTHAAYISGIDYCTVIDRDARQAVGHREGEPDLGGTVSPGPDDPSGTFTAVDVGSGRVLWERRLPAPMIGGATATAGGLVFAGDSDGRLYGFDAGDGRIVWRRRFAAGFGSAPIVYAIDGTEYLAVVSGGAAVAAIDRLGPTGAKLVVFKLG